MYQAGSFRTNCCQHIGHSLLLCDLNERQIQLELFNLSGYRVSQWNTTKHNYKSLPFKNTLKMIFMLAAGNLKQAELH